MMFMSDENKEISIFNFMANVCVCVCMLNLVNGISIFSLSACSFFWDIDLIIILMIYNNKALRTLIKYHEIHFFQFIKLLAMIFDNDSFFIYEDASS